MTQPPHKMSGVIAGAIALIAGAVLYVVAETVAATLAILGGNLVAVLAEQPAHRKPPLSGTPPTTTDLTSSTGSSPMHLPTTERTRI